MLRDRAASVDLFALMPVLELRLEPELAELDRLLEDDQLFQRVKADLSRRRPRMVETGRPSTPVEVILRLLVIQRLVRYAQLVGRENVIAASDCGFGTFAFRPLRVHPEIMWAKFAAMVESARLASEQLWQD